MKAQKKVVKNTILLSFRHNQEICFHTLNFQHINLLISQFLIKSKAVAMVSIRTAFSLISTWKSQKVIHSLSLLCILSYYSSHFISDDFKVKWGRGGKERGSGQWAELFLWFEVLLAYFLKLCPGFEISVTCFWKLQQTYEPFIPQWAWIVYHCKHWCRKLKYMYNKNKSLANLPANKIAVASLHYTKTSQLLVWSRTLQQHNAIYWVCKTTVSIQNHTSLKEKKVWNKQ